MGRRENATKKKKKKRSSCYAEVVIHSEQFQWRARSTLSVPPFVEAHVYSARPVGDVCRAQSHPPRASCAPDRHNGDGLVTGNDKEREKGRTFSGRRRERFECARGARTVKAVVTAAREKETWRETGGCGARDEERATMKRKRDGDGERRPVGKRIN